MRITIVGAGRVGIHLAKYFADEQQDVFIVDNNPEHLAVLESDFNLRTFVGEPTDLGTLRDANSDKADIFVAVTADTPENIVACAMAKSMGAKKTIARVDEYAYLLPDNEAVVKKMGVDHVVFPDFLAAQTVISSLEHGWCRAWSEFENGSIIMVAVAVSEEAPIAGKYLKEFFSENRSLHISALRRNHNTLIPVGTDKILPDDVLYVTATPEGIDKIRELTGVSPFEIKNVILMGGSMTAQLAAQLAAGKFDVTIIEKNRDRCRRLMQECPDVDIICGDGSELDVLQEAGINNCDAFVALTDNTEGNILSCLTAHDIGVKKNIAEVEKEQLIAKAESFRIDSIVNKPVITSTSIFQLILDSEIYSSDYLSLPDAEIGRLPVKEGSFLTKQPVMRLKLPHGLTFAGVIRNGQGAMVTGNTILQSGDIVIVICLPGSLKRVEKLFGK